MSDAIYQRSTLGLSAHDQFDYWRHAICDAYVPLEPARGSSRQFAGVIDGLALPALHSSTIAADAHEVRLGRSGLLARDGTPFYANLICEGEAVVTQGEVTQRVGPGDIYVVDCSAEWKVDFTTAFRMFCIEIDDGLLRPRLGRRGRLFSPVLKGDAGVGRVLASYMRLVQELAPSDLLPMSGLMANHCCELLGRAQTHDSPEERQARVRREILDKVLELMRRRIGDASLTPESACAELGVSRSYLFKLLAEHGYSFSGHLRQSRLEECRRLLRDQPKRPVADIAADFGFNDLSTFGRAYRNAFGCAPGQERA